MIEYFEWLLIVATSLYCAQMLIFLAGLFFPNKKRHPAKPFVSVVIAARNEEKNIPNLMEDLKKQSYPEDNYEIILVDDFSSDGTRLLAEHISSKYGNLKVISSTSKKTARMTAKKNAIQLGINTSRGDIILTTDADCRVQPGWIEEMVSCFTEDVGMVVGFSQMGSRDEKRSLFEQLQALDFLALLSAAQGSLNINFPLAATGQNLAYRRKTFKEVGGFNDVGHRISGDDVLLLQLIYKKTRWKIRFAPSAKCYNRTEPEKNIRSFLNQRKRWASNGAYQFILNKKFFLMVLNTFAVNLLMLFGLFLLIFNKADAVIILSAFVLKIFSEFALLIKGARIYLRNDLIKYFPLWAAVQIPYVVIAGTFGNLGGFTWKDRVH